MVKGFLAGESPEKGGGSRETRWLTPASLVEPLGEFDLDPAGAPGHKLAARTFLLENGEDGLELPWHGRVWLNPPYDRIPCAAFLRRLVEHGTGTALIFARTETAIFHEAVWGAASAVLFLRGRVTFLDASLRPASASAGAPSCLIAYGERDANALHAAVARGDLRGHVVNLPSAA